METPLAGCSGKQDQHGDSLAGTLDLGSLLGQGEGEGKSVCQGLYSPDPPITLGPHTNCDQPLGTTESRTVSVEEIVSALAHILPPFSFRPSPHAEEAPVTPTSGWEQQTPSGSQGFYLALGH